MTLHLVHFQTDLSAHHDSHSFFESNHDFLFRFRRDDGVLSALLIPFTPSCPSSVYVQNAYFASRPDVIFLGNIFVIFLFFSLTWVVRFTDPPKGQSTPPENMATLGIKVPIFLLNATGFKWPNL